MSRRLKKALPRLCLFVVMAFSWPIMANAQISIGYSSTGLAESENSKLVDPITDGWIETSLGSYTASAPLIFSNATASTDSSFDSINEILVFNGELLADAGLDPSGFGSMSTANVENTLDFTLTSARDFVFSGNEILVGDATGSIVLHNADNSESYSLGSSGTLVAGTWTLATIHEVNSMSLPPVAGLVSTASYNSTLSLFAVQVPEPSSLLVTMALAGMVMSKRTRRV